MSPRPPDFPSVPPPPAPFFSVIVPCCDVGPYLPECLASLLEQPFADWECLLVVEESRDGTLGLARDRAAADPRFRVFTGPRTGSCSVPRNRGIEEARGRYAVFLDGDDTLVPGSLARVAAAIAARPGADLYPCRMKVRDETDGRGEPDRDNYPPGFSGELAGPEATRMAYTFRRFPCPMLQLTVFRRGYLLEQGLRCLPGRRRQDSEFAPRALYLARRVVPLHEPLYVYRIRPGSVSTLSGGTGYYHEDYAAILGSLMAFHERMRRSPGFDPSVSRLWARHWLTWLTYYWFSPRAIRETPRQRRRETLAKAFPGGFAAFDALMRASTRARRVAGWHVKLSLRHPRLAWWTDLFFRRFYYPLGDLRDRFRAVR